MSSDQDPLNSTGSNLPVFGKIKKLGEEEAAPEENFIPQEEYYDPADFQNQQEQAPEAPEPPPMVQPPAQEQNTPLQLKKPQAPQSPGHAPRPPQAPNYRDNMPHGASEEENQHLRNRTAAHLEHKQRAEQTIAQFDEYFEQEMKSEPGFIETYFKMGDTFSPKARKIIAGLAAGCLIFGIAISLQSFWLNLIFSLISFQAVLVLSLQKGTLNKLGLFPGRIILAGVLSLAFILVPLSYKWWQEQGENYISSFQNVEDLANEAQDKLKEGVKKTEGTTGEYIDSEAIATHEFKYSSKLVKDFHDSTYLSGGGLLQMYLQYVFMLLGLVLLPFIKERNLLKVHYLRAENTKMQWKVARYFMVRMFKGSIIAIVFAVGLNLAGCDNVMFIAGTTFLLSCISRFGPIVGLVMCIPVVITEFRSGDGMMALTGLAITGLVALLVESKIHWLMMILPIKDKSFIPPSLARAKPPVVKVEGGGGSNLISGFMGLAMNLAFYGALAFLGWKTYGIWQNYSNVEKDIPRQVKKSTGDQKGKAVAILEEYQEKNPYHRELWFSLTKAYTRSGQLDKALDAAKKYRDFKSPEPDAEGLMEKGEQYVLKFLSKTNTKEKSNKALIWLLDNFIELQADQVDSTALLFIIKEMHDTNPEEIRTYVMAGVYYMAKQDYDMVRSWSTKGLKIDSENAELHKNIVKTWIAENDKQRALRAMIELHKVNTSDPEIDELNKKINSME